VVHAAAPGIEETLKWGIPHFMRDGIVCSMAAFKQHCVFGFWKHALVVKDDGERSGDAMGSFGRIESLSDLPSRKSLTGVRPRGRAAQRGGPEASEDGRTEAPEDTRDAEALRVALAGNAQARAAFERLTPSQRYEYVEWIAEAKRDDTRERRLATALDWIAEGKTRHWKYQKC
jgi:hypothetical protein